MSKINKNSKRRRRIVRNYNSTPTSIVSSTQNPVFGFINPRVKTTLKLNRVVPITTLATTVGTSYGFQINSLFDPDPSGGGAAHQPYGFDTLSGIYTRYRVIKCKWNIEFSPSSDRLCVGIILSSQQITAVTNLATYQLAAESPLSENKALAFSGGPPARFYGQRSLNTIMGLTPSQMMNDDTYSAPVTANPAQLVYLYVYAYNPSTTTVTANINVNLWFESIMYDPYLQNQS